MRRTRIAGSAAALLLSVGTAACGFLAGPAANAQSAGAASTAAAHVKRAPKPPVIGVNLYVDKNYTLAQTKEFGARDLKYIADTLKLKAVELDWNYNVPSKYANKVIASPTRTPTIADLTALTDMARGLGLKVMYRVLFLVHNQDLRSGSIQPKHFPEWLGWLLRTETPALKLAEQEHVSEFVAGTEMATIDQSPLWGGFFRKAGKIYHGTLSYAAWGGRPGLGGYFSSQRVLLPIRLFGASAYPSIDLPPTASVSRLTTAWEAFLLHAPRALLRITQLDEMGIPAVNGAYHDPWQWTGLTGPANPVVQARWFEAACRAVNALHLRGLYFWSLVLSQNPAFTGNSLTAFAGRPDSEAAIRNCVS
jgi:hypothetical protein